MYSISHLSKSIVGTIDLTASKSISNRLLVIQALCNKTFEIRNLASAQDTQTLQLLLENYKKEYILNVGPAGTVMRFLTAFLAVQPEGEWLLTGSDRMLKRPIGPLTKALRYLGAHISYINEEGFPPLHIHGNLIHGGRVEVDGNLSSQFITSLLLVAPQLKNGLELHLKGEITSKPYIEMTLVLMKHFGAEVNWSGNTINVKPKPYKKESLQNSSFTVESDWSGASYWYAIAALSKNANIIVRGLYEKSLQGDSVLATIFDKLGVATEYVSSGLHLTKKAIETDVFEYDFSSCPDIAQTLAVVVAGLGIKGSLKGLHTLKIKETDRVEAIVSELSKLGYNVDVSGNEKDEIIIEKGKREVVKKNILTYEDHRMAMAFSPLALVLNEVCIENPEVVGKSYPEYWKHLQSVGFEIK